MTTANDRRPRVSVAADWVNHYRPVLNRLQGFRDHGNGRGRAVCPCDHGGKGGAELSLSIGEKGGLFLKCFPRHSATPECDSETVMRRLGLPVWMLYPTWPERAERERSTPLPPKGDQMRHKDPDERFTTTATYEYWDVNPEGATYLSYAVEKKVGDKGGKDFPTKRPNPEFDRTKRAGKDNPEWLWGMGDVRRILYRLPELREGLRQNRKRWVLLPEGEKDVETARQLGFLATCNPGGVMKWLDPKGRDLYSDELKGCNVIILVDEDQVREDPSKPGAFRCPGVDHARQVATVLLGKAAIIKVLRLPGVPFEGDLTDWKLMKEEEARKSGLPFGDTEAKGALGQLIQTALTIKTQDDIASIVPRGERQWPIPDGHLPQSDYLKAPPKAGKPNATPDLKPAEDAPAPPAPGGATGLEALAKKVADLKLVAPNGPRSVAEWLGEVLMASDAFAAARAHLTANDPRVVRDAALYLAAQLVRGVDSVPELRPGG